MIHIVKRDGRVVPYDVTRIEQAIQAAWKEVHPAPMPTGVLTELLAAVEHRLFVQAANSINTHSVETIQDAVEEELAKIDFAVARRFILYREERSKARQFGITLANGNEFDHADLRSLLHECGGELPHIDYKALEQEIIATLADGMTLKDVLQAVIFAARARIERGIEYSSFAARALLRVLYAEVDRAVHTVETNNALEASLRFGVDAGRYDARLLSFDLDRLNNLMVWERDQDFKYLGLQTLYDRYLIHVDGQRIETPQILWMRVAMGLALNEERPTERAFEFYEALSTFRLCSSTPTLFNAGTPKPQLSSCYLLTLDDDLESIFNLYGECAQLSKWAGGLGVDFTPVRALNSHIEGVNGKSSGTVPFLKILNDTVAGVSQAGKRRGSAAAYMENWHLDFEDFLDLRKATGDERRRTHELNIAAWVSDLFMERVIADGEWTLLDPREVGDLHDLYGDAFKTRYEWYEREFDAGRLMGRRTSATALWRKMLGSLFETGHPWITWKDPINLRSPQDHVGVVHSSNLCTEITLNTSFDEIAVCNLASINLPQHMRNGALDEHTLSQTVHTAVRMLDNVIDINFYPVEKARNSNLRHRPIGLGLMGFQDALWEAGLTYASEDAIAFADRSMELISFYALHASCSLSAERGAYPTFDGSKWDRGFLPIDTQSSLKLQRGARGELLSTATRLEWEHLRTRIRLVGLRNSNVLAIAPTATISNIQGVTQSIEPLYSNLFVKSNLSGEFTMVNDYLVRDLRELGLWDQEMLDEIKYHDGSIAEITRIPVAIRRKYLTAFEIEPEWLIACGARRQKWIDQAQSLNLYISAPSGKRLSDMYLLAWRMGLKTTYYLRSRGATSVEKSTLDLNKFGIAPRWMQNHGETAQLATASNDLDIEDESIFCETCQ